MLTGAGGAFGRQAALPGERMADDGVEVVELRPPVERRLDAGDVGDQRGRIAGPAAGALDREIAADRAPHRVDHLEHRGAAAVAAIEGRASAPECARTRSLTWM